MGVVVSDTTSDTAMAMLKTTANSRNSRPTIPPISRMGMNTATSEVLMESTVKPISLEPLKAARTGCLAGLDVARDVLDDDNRVVHHEPGGDGQRHQRQVVDGVMQQVHQRHGAEQRQRDGDAGNEGCGRVAQEQEDHQDNQRDGDGKRELDVLHRAADGGGAVIHHRQLHRTAGSRPGTAAAARECGPRCR